MVIPMPITQQGSILTLSDELRSKLNIVKYCVFLLWGLGVLQFFLQPISAFSTVILAIFGTFLLGEDPQMAKCFNILRDSVLGQCCGSGALAMLLPYMIFSSLNSVLDGMQLLELFTVGGLKVLTYPVVDVLFGIWVCELVSAVLSYQVFKATMPEMPDGGGGMQGVPARGPAGYQPLAGGPTMGSGWPGGAPRGQPTAPSRPAQPQNFQVFSGQGNRLGG